MDDPALEFTRDIIDTIYEDMRYNGYDSILVEEVDGHLIATYYRDGEDVTDKVLD